MSARVRRLARRGRERGSVTATELVILVPLFMMLFLLVVFCGRLINAKGVVEGAARDAVRAASIARSAGDAAAAADTAASTDLAGMGGARCAFNGATVSGWAPGGQVVVEVSCTISLSDLSMLGIPGSKTITATQRAPVDRFRGTQ